ncbi:hypothetical protein [Ktedonospora formicarum]|uniref:hypothetical protein n=1 Tax=Ktedonospora formicarum TaxID=2778364 RepID=UPI001C68A08D|nr:hypothetical protein [Ktedonospora formicarum]
MHSCQDAACLPDAAQYPIQHRLMTMQQDPTRKVSPNMLAGNKIACGPDQTRMGDVTAVLDGNLLHSLYS